jgi:hypothetical protein
MHNSSLMRNRIILIAAAALCAITLPGVPANAATMDTAQLKVSCTTNRVCGWSAIGFGGLGTTALPVASGQCNNLPISVRSAWNAAYVSQRFWQYSNCTGSNVVLLPGTTNGDMIVGHRGLGGY